MPKPNVTYAGLKRMMKTAKRWSYSGAAIEKFLQEGENIFDNNYAKNVKRCLDDLTLTTEREGIGALFLMCMLGETDKNTKQPAYKMSDVMNADSLADEKKQLGKRIEDLILYKLDTKIDPKEQKAYDEYLLKSELNTRTVDTLILKGLKRACERLEAMTMKNIQENNFAGFFTPEFAILSNLCTIMLTNNVQGSYANGKLKPGSFIDRIQQKYVAGKNDKGIEIYKSIQENVLGKDTDINAFISRYEEMSGFVASIFYYASGLEKVVEDDQHNFPGLETYLTFEKIRKVYAANPNASQEEIFGQYYEYELAQRHDEGIHDDESGAQMSAFAYTTLVVEAIESFEGEPLQEAIKDNPELEEDYPEKATYIKNYRNIYNNRNDAVYKYGLGIMSLNGELYENVKTNIKLEFTKVGDNKSSCGIDNNSSVSFKNNFDRKTVLRAAFLADMEIGEYSNVEADYETIKAGYELLKDSFEKLEKNAPEALKLPEDIAGLRDALKNISDMLKDAPNARTVKNYKDLSNALSDLKDKYYLNDAKGVEKFFYVQKDEDIEKKLELNKDDVKNLKKDILEKANSNKTLNDTERQLYVHYIMTEVKNYLRTNRISINTVALRADMRKDLMESGARFHRYKDTGELPDAEVLEEQFQVLRDLKNELKELEPKAFASKEWGNMQKALDKVNEISQNFDRNKATDVEKLTSALRIAQHTARRYVSHKVDTNGLSGDDKDFKRLKCAKRIESFGDLNSKYLFSKMTMNMTKVHNEKGFFSKESIKEDYETTLRMKNDLMELRRRTVTASKELKGMLEAVERLNTYQKGLVQNLNNGGELSQEDDKTYFGFTVNGTHQLGLVDKTYNKVQEYIKHRLQKNDFSDYYGDRFDMALRIRSYLEAIKSGSEKTRAVREKHYDDVNRERLEANRQRKAVQNFNSQYENAVDDARDIIIDAKKDLKVKEIDHNEPIPEKDVKKLSEKLYIICTKVKLDAGDEEVTNFIKAEKYDEAIKKVKEDNAAKQMVEYYSHRIKGSNIMTGPNGLQLTKKCLEQINIKIGEYKENGQIFSYEDYKREQEESQNANAKAKQEEKSPKVRK